MSSPTLSPSLNPTLRNVASRSDDRSRHPAADRLSWLWLLVAIVVLALGALVGGRKW